MIDTSGERCSVALWTPEKTVACFSDEPQSHAKKLLGLVDGLLADVNLVPSDIEAIAVVNGPGSFTGVRIGLSTAQGLAFAIGCPVITVPSLLCLAFSKIQASEQGQYVIAALDARMRELYVAAYYLNDGSITVVAPPQICAQDSFVAWFTELPMSATPVPTLGLGSGFTCNPVKDRICEVNQIINPVFDDCQVVASDMLAFFTRCGLIQDNQLYLDVAKSLNEVGISRFDQPEDISALYLRNEISWEKRTRIRQQ